MRPVRVVIVIPGRHDDAPKVVLFSRRAILKIKRGEEKKMKVKIQLVPDEINRTQRSVYSARSSSSIDVPPHPLHGERYPVTNNWTRIDRKEAGCPVIVDECVTHILLLHHRKSANSLVQ